MKTNKLQSGFSLVTILVIVVAVAIVGYVGFRGYEVVKSNMDSNEAALSQPAVADDVPAAIEVVDTSDLDEASALLDQIDLDDGTDEALLDSEMAAF